jgi:hypothetical protein
MKAVTNGAVITIDTITMQAKYINQQLSLNL